jgi:hypothetical protein
LESHENLYLNLYRIFISLTDNAPHVLDLTLIAAAAAASARAETPLTKARMKAVSRCVCLPLLIIIAQKS